MRKPGSLKIVLWDRLSSMRLKPSRYYLVPHVITPAMRCGVRQLRIAL
jgi:hypothetical protein